MNYGLEDNQISLTLESLGVKHMFLFTRRKKHKLDSHSHECFFLRYSEKFKAYCLMYIHDRKEVISRDVIFNKGKNTIKRAT